MREAVADHSMRGKWVKGGRARPHSMATHHSIIGETSPVLDLGKSCAEDEQISALLDRSMMMSCSTAPRRSSENDRCVLCACVFVYACVGARMCMWDIVSADDFDG